MTLVARVVVGWRERERLASAAVQFVRFSGKTRIQLLASPWLKPHLVVVPVMEAVRSLEERKAAKLAYNREWDRLNRGAQNVLRRRRRRKNAARDNAKRRAYYAANVERMRDRLKLERRAQRAFLRADKVAWRIYLDRDAERARLARAKKKSGGMGAQRPI